MRRKTVYIRDEDEAMWSSAQRAAERAGSSLSAVIAAGLRRYVDEKEDELRQLQAVNHGAMTKQLLYVWGSRADEFTTAWGTSFQSDGLGPDRARLLMTSMKGDPTIRHVELEERRVYQDGAIDRRELEFWSRDPTGNWVRER